MGSVASTSGSEKGASMRSSQDGSGRMLSLSTSAMTSPTAALMPAVLPASPVLRGLGTMRSTPAARAISSVRSAEPASASTIS